MRTVRLSPSSTVPSPASKSLLPSSGYYEYNHPTKSTNNRGGWWMQKGAIYSDKEKCGVCGERFKDNHRDGLVCPEHTNQRSQRDFRVVFEGGLGKRKIWL